MGNNFKEMRFEKTECEENYKETKKSRKKYKKFRNRLIALLLVGTTAVVGVKVGANYLEKKSLMDKLPTMEQLLEDKNDVVTIDDTLVEEAIENPSINDYKEDYLNLIEYVNIVKKINDMGLDQQINKLDLYYLDNMEKDIENLPDIENLKEQIKIVKTSTQETDELKQVRCDLYKNFLTLYKYIATNSDRIMEKYGLIFVKGLVLEAYNENTVYYDFNLNQLKIHFSEDLSSTVENNGIPTKNSYGMQKYASIPSNTIFEDVIINICNCQTRQNQKNKIEEQYNDEKIYQIESMNNNLLYLAVSGVEIPSDDYRKLEIKNEDPKKIIKQMKK